MDDGVGRQTVDETSHRLEQRVPVTAFQIDPSDRPREQEIAREQLVAGEERDVAGRVPGPKKLIY